MIGSDERIRAALAAGVELRGRVAAYRSARTAAVRAAAGFRELADRVGAALETPGREC